MTTMRRANPRTCEQAKGRHIPDYAPVVLIAVYGIVWIGLHASASRWHAHILFQLIALTENVIALALRRRKPVGALVSILIVYTITALVALALPAVVLGLYTAVTVSPPRRAARCFLATALVIIASALLQRDPVTSITVAAPIALGASGLAFIAGQRVRTRLGTGPWPH